MVGIDYEMWLLDKYGSPEYKELFHVLANRDYIWQMILDKNRSLSGLHLRDRCSYELGVYLSDVADGPCSVLEMLCALSEDMASSCDIGQEEPYFVMELLGNLRLLDYTGHLTNIEIRNINYILDIWLDREYEPNGDGSIFRIENCNRDLRTMDTWSQMNLYLNIVYPFDENFLKEDL